MSVRGVIKFFLFLSLLSLSGCTTLLNTGNSRKTEEGVAAANYAAADMLMQQSRSFVSPQTPLEIGLLTDLDNPNEQTNFGQMVAQQIGSRFVQLGYNVIVDAQSAANGEPVGSMSPPPLIAPGAGSDVYGRSLLTGRYSVARSNVLINLRIIEFSSGKVLAAYDYNIPKTRDVAELVKTKADKDSFFDF